MATFPQGYHNEQTQKGEKKRNEIKMEDFHQIGKVMGFKRCVLCYFTSYICKQVGFIVTNSLPGVVVDIHIFNRNRLETNTFFSCEASLSS